MQGFLKLPEFSKLDLTKVEAELDQLLVSGDKKIKALESVTDPTWENFVYELDKVVDDVQCFFSPVRHLNAVMNNDEIREVYNVCMPKLTAWYTELGQNKALYQGILKLKDSAGFKALDHGQKKSIEDQLQSFELGGVALEGAERDRYKAIAAESSKLSTKFNENVLDSGNLWSKHVTDEKALDGFPESSLQLAQQAAKLQDKAGYLLKLDFPNYHAVMTFAVDRELREEMYLAWNTRATTNDFDNAKIIEKTLALRAEKAQK